jgi:DNA-binding response OmpR family regulator
MIRILIIEDEFLIANLIKDSLTNLGYECKCLHDGEAAATSR